MVTLKKKGQKNKFTVENFPKKNSIIIKKISFPYLWYVKKTQIYSWYLPKNKFCLKNSFPIKTGQIFFAVQKLRSEFFVAIHSVTYLSQSKFD